MAAYSAIACFKRTLRQLLDSDELPLPFRKPQIEYLYENVSSLQSSLDYIPFVPKGKRIDMNKLQTEIRDAIYAAQDEVESSIKAHSSQKSTEINSLKEIADNINLVAKEAEVMVEEIRNDQHSQYWFSENAPQPTKFSSRGNDTIVRQEKDFKIITDLLKSEDKQRLVIPITGLTGSGKTSLARNIYRSKEVQNNFNIHAWVTVSNDYNFQGIFSKILNSMDSKNYQAGRRYSTQDDEQALFNKLHQELYNLKYLIVLDDVWDTRSWDRIIMALPDKENGSRILLTSRITEVAESIQKNGYIHKMEPLGLDDSWKYEIVGQEEDFKTVMEYLEPEDKRRMLIPITGLPGLGKTTLARSIYVSKEAQSDFNIRAWVTVTQDYNFQEIFSKLLSSMESKNYQAGFYATQGDEQTLFYKLHQELYNLKYLIVLDDVWDTRSWDRIELALPDKENGSRILLTSRITKVVETIKKSGFILTMKPLGLEDSWKLLCCKVFFGDIDNSKKDITEACPPHLRDTGRSIAKKCEGLPLSLTVVAGLLVQRKPTIEHWRKIEEDTADAAAKDEDSYLAILSLSYTYLPGRLKGCFLYMGAFPEDCEIRVSKLIKLWVAEGFLPLPPSDPGLELKAEEFVEDLIGRNLIAIRRKSSCGGMKVCGMHGSLRELAEKESRIEKFFHCRKKYSQEPEENIMDQRRVSIHKNLLMSVEKVYESTKSIVNARSLLYVGPHHHHPLPFCLSFDLLRVLDAFTVYFIQFPYEFLQLIHLAYLALTYNDNLPPKISQLQNLQTLMVRREPKIIFIGVSFLPDEIWTMPRLRHLWFTETDFPALPPSSPEIALLLNLQTLANVDAAFFTDEILDNMPNLKKLTMWIESPDKIGFNVAKLSKLEHFKFVVLNPIPGKGIEVEAEHFFPKTLKRVTLSGCGLPWEYMEFVARNLLDLEVLKLKELAFYGGEWILDYKLKKLRYLLIEYLNFRVWEADCSNFPRLKRLILRHCYELEEIPQDLGFIDALELIEMVDCSPQAVESAEVISDEQEGYDKKDFQVLIFSSWE